MRVEPGHRAPRKRKEVRRRNPTPQECQERYGERPHDELQAARRRVRSGATPPVRYIPQNFWATMLLEVPRFPLHNWSGKCETR